MHIRNNKTGQTYEVTKEGWQALIRAQVQRRYTILSDDDSVSFDIPIQVTEFMGDSYTKYNKITKAKLIEEAKSRGLVVGKKLKAQIINLLITDDRK